MRVTSRHPACRLCRRNRSMLIAVTALAFYFLALALTAGIDPGPEWAPMPHVLIADLATVPGIFTAIGLIYPRINNHARHPGARVSR